MGRSRLPFPHVRQDRRGEKVLSRRENVSFGLVGTAWEHADEDEKFKLIKAACVKANADTFIEKLPEGKFDKISRARSRSHVVLLHQGTRQTSENGVSCCQAARNVSFRLSREIPS